MAPTPSFCPMCAAALVTVERGGIQRLACPDCDWVHWNNPTPVVAAIVLHEGEVVLVRNVGWPESWFGLVTGFLEAGETPEAGIIREVQEELGLVATIREFVGVYAFRRMNQLIVAYVVEATGTIELGDELEAFKRIAPDKLRPWPFGTGHAVRDWLERRNAAQK